MHSVSAPREPNSPTPVRGLVDTLKRWNRKLHYYLGLYLLFFLWLFAFTGPLLNHSHWALAMDAVAVGLIVLVFTSIYRWYELKPKHRMGLIVLSLGLLSCGLFCVGLRWIF